MGWKLAEEIAWARPERPGTEWWTLLDIAQDARDETRRGMPGMDYLMARGKCSRATLFRRLEALKKAGLLTVASAGRGRKRAVYEIAVIHKGLSVSETLQGLSVSETQAEANRVSVFANRVSKTGSQGLSVSETPSVNTPVIHPSINEAPVVTPSVEVPGNGSASRLPIELQAWRAIHPSEEVAANA